MATAVPKEKKNTPKRVVKVCAMFSAPTTARPLVDRICVMVTIPEDQRSSFTNRGIPFNMMFLVKSLPIRSER